MKTVRPPLVASAFAASGEKRAGARKPSTVRVALPITPTPANSLTDLTSCFRGNVATFLAPDVLCYYGYRWYNTYTGGWPSPDPIGERGGLNLYGFVGNDGVNWIDLLGLNIVVVSGGINTDTNRNNADHHWANFIIAAKLRIRELKNELKEGEEIEWLVELSSLSQRNHFDKSKFPLRNLLMPDVLYLQTVAEIASQEGVRLRWYSNKQQFRDLINTVPPYWDTNLEHPPRSDNELISKFVFYGHGDPGNTWLKYKDQQSYISSEDISSGLLLKQAFSKLCICETWSCRAANPQSNGEASVKQAWESYFGFTIKAAYGRTAYYATATGNPPTLGLQEGPGSAPSYWAD